MLYWWHAHLRRFSLGTCKIIGGWYQSVYAFARERGGGKGRAGLSVSCRKIIGGWNQGVSAFAGERGGGNGRAGLSESCRTFLDLTPFLALALLLSCSLALVLSRSDLTGLSLPLFLYLCSTFKQKKNPLSLFPHSLLPFSSSSSSLCISLTVPVHTSRRSSQSPIASGGRFCTAMVSPRVVIMTFICVDLGLRVEGLRFRV